MGIDLVISTEKMNGCAAHFGELPEAERQNRVNTLRYNIYTADYDYMILDMAPTLNVIAESLLRMADGVIVPIELGTFAIQGIANVTDTIARVGGSFTGCYITKYDKDNKADAELKDLLTDTLGNKVFDSVIPNSKIIRNSLNYRLTAYEYMYWMPPVKQYILLAKEIMERT